VKTISEDIKEKIKVVDKEIAEIETEIAIETEEIEEIADQDPKIEAEEINVKKIVDKDHSQEILLWKESL